MPRPETSLSGRRVLLRPGRDDDVPALLAIRSEPAVRRWWREPEPAAELAAQLRGDGGDVAFVIEIDGAVAGLVQFAEEDDPDYRHAGIDIYLAERWQGRGLGTETIRLLAGYLFGARGHHRLTIDPAAANTAAVRCYTRAGFRPVGRLRRYERAEDGSWHDGLLMDLLADEFDPARGPAVGPEPAMTRDLVLDQPLDDLTVARVEVRRIRMSPGLAPGAHEHNGPVLGSVVEGSVLFQVADGPPTVLRPGDVFHEPAGTLITHFDALADGAVFLGYFPLAPGQQAEIIFTD